MLHQATFTAARAVQLDRAASEVKS